MTAPALERRARKVPARLVVQALTDLDGNPIEGEQGREIERAMREAREARGRNDRTS